MVEEAGRAGSSRVVLSDKVDVGAVGSVGRLADSNENVRLGLNVSRRTVWERCEGRHAIVRVAMRPVGEESTEAAMSKRD